MELIHYAHPQQSNRQSGILYGIHQSDTNRHSETTASHAAGHQQLAYAPPRTIRGDTVLCLLFQLLSNQCSQPQSARGPLPGPRLFRLTRSIRFFLRETAHWAVARLAPPVDVVLKDAHLKESLIRNSEQITRKRPPTSGRSFSCGLYWTRTSDPIDVNDVLYQLSQQTIGTGVIIPTHFFFVKA